MPDHSFPEINLFRGFPSAVQTLIGVEQTPSFSSLAKSDQGAWNGAWTNKVYEYSPEVSSRLGVSIFHADPLAPLRQRDEQALEEIFDDAQMEEVFVDVCDRLKQLYPEPCWDEDPFEFLQDYM